METALQVVGALMIADLAMAFAWVSLVALVGRRGRRVPLSVLLGAMIFLGVCSILVYGSLTLILQLGRN
jgi:hypothetical protein